MTWPIPLYVHVYTTACVISLVNRDKLHTCVIKYTKYAHLGDEYDDLHVHMMMLTFGVTFMT